MLKRRQQLLANGQGLYSYQDIFNLEHLLFDVTPGHCISSLNYILLESLYSEKLIIMITATQICHITNANTHYRLYIIINKNYRQKTTKLLWTPLIVTIVGPGDLCTLISLRIIFMLSRYTLVSVGATAVQCRVVKSIEGGSS